MILKFQEFKINSQTEYEKMKSEQNTSGLKINEDVLDKNYFSKICRGKMCLKIKMTGYFENMILKRRPEFQTEKMTFYLGLTIRVK